MVDTNFLDVDELLAGGTEISPEEIDADAILGDENDYFIGHDGKIVEEEKSSSIFPTTANSENTSNNDDNLVPSFATGLDEEETEQLDYEEDIEEESTTKNSRESKFVSERVDSSTTVKKLEESSKDTTNNQTTTTDHKKYPRTNNYSRNDHGGSNHKVKYYINPNFKGPLPSSLVHGQRPNSGIPHLSQLRPTLPFHHQLLKPYVNLNLQPSTSIRPPMQNFIRPTYSTNIPPPTHNPPLILPPTQQQQNFLPPQQQQQPFGNPLQNFNQPPNFMPQVRPPPIRDPNICRLPTVHIRPQIVTSSYAPPMNPGTHFSMGGSTLPNVTSEAVNWSLMVDAFVKKTTSESMIGFKRSASLSSRSRSYSASSYSNSTGSYSRSRSRTRSPQKNGELRGERKVFRAKRNEDSRNERSRGRHLQKRANYESRSKSKRETPKPDLKTTIECAEAIGLDEEYVKKIEQQKKLREEIAQRKKLHREEHFGQNNAKNERGSKHPSSQRPDTGRRSPIRGGGSGNRRQISPIRNHGVGEDRRRSGRDRNRFSPPPPKTLRAETSTNNSGNNTTHITTNNNNNKKLNAVSTSQNGKESLKSSNDLKNSSQIEQKLSAETAPAVGKTKAYLAVVVSNLKEMNNAFKRISLLASSVGNTKKVWQATENAISVIFEKHEHAKHFMLQYHGKSVNGCRLDVTLEKVFLNLAAMP